MDAGTVDAGTVDAGTVPLARDSAAASAICVCFILYKKHIFQKRYRKTILIHDFIRKKYTDFDGDVNFP